MARHKAAFLVNLWFESRERGEPPSARWRGSVEHLTTGKRRYFSEIVDLVTFLTAYAREHDLEGQEPGP